MTPVAGTTILDMGTGGGFPGIPLAILWPHCRFHLIDRTGKKIKVASSIAAEAGLTNVTFQHGDIAECKEKFDYVVSRAVMQLDALIRLVRKNISRDSSNSFPNGLLCLKGGELKQETAVVRCPMIEVLSATISLKNSSRQKNLFTWNYEYKNIPFQHVRGQHLCGVGRCLT